MCENEISKYAERHRMSTQTHLILNRKDPESCYDFLATLWASQVTLVIKDPPTNAGDIRDAAYPSSLHQEDHLEEGRAIHSNILA